MSKANRNANRNALIRFKEKLFHTVMDDGSNSSLPVNFVIALRNASCHGEIFNKAHYQITDETESALNLWHECLDTMLTCAKLIQNDIEGDLSEKEEVLVRDEIARKLELLNSK